jgi:hypothetical protein
MLYILGDVVFDVWPTNVDAAHRERGQDWAAKELIGAQPNREAIDAAASLRRLFAKKWIKVPVTLIEVDERHSIPLQNSASGQAPQGRQVNIEHAPMTSVEVEAAEADRLLALYAAHGAVEVPPPESLASAADSPPHRCSTEGKNHDDEITRRRRAGRAGLCHPRRLAEVSADASRRSREDENVDGNCR